MLPAVSRLRSSDEFKLVTRSGTRSGNKHVVVYCFDDGTQGADLSPKVGFVVGKQVGNSVVRHRVVRKLRHIMREELPFLTASHVVVRALPHSASADFETLKSAVRSELARVCAVQDS